MIVTSDRGQIAGLLALAWDLSTPIDGAKGSESRRFMPVIESDYGEAWIDNQSAFATSRRVKNQQRRLGRRIPHREVTAVFEPVQLRLWERRLRSRGLLRVAHVIVAAPTNGDRASIGLGRSAELHRPRDERIEHRPERNRLFEVLKFL